MENRHNLESDGSVRLEQTINGMLEQMNELGYAQITIRQYGKCWQRLQQFAADVMDTDCYSDELAERFLRHAGYTPDNLPCPMPRSLERILTSLRMFSEYATQGHVRYKKQPDRRLTLPEEFLAAMTSQEQHRVLAGDRPSTLRGYRQHLPSFLGFLQNTGVKRLSDIEPQHISDFMITQSHRTPNTISGVASIIRTFMRFLYQRNIIDTDLSGSVPSCRRRAYLKIPTVWRQDEIQRMLEQVDRSSPQGKRDYAVLLLATRLGIRIGDIIRLSLDDIDWRKQTIVVRQSKTLRHVLLPLAEDVGWAIIDYLKYGRPPSSHREVFLQCKAPYEPFVDNYNMYHIVTKYRRMAGIYLPPGGRCGMHTLRHSLASNLLAEDTPLSIIASILGHSSIETTQEYAKVDMKHLRQCAIDPEEDGNA